MSAPSTRSLEGAILAATADALSDMAFVDAVAAPGADELPPTSHIIAVGFSRPVRGQIVLYLPLECKRLVVENVYARDWDSLSAAEIDDCLLELANVVAGNFLVSYCGKDTPHDVALPQLLFDDAETSAGSERVEIRLDAEGRALKVSVCLE